MTTNYFELRLTKEIIKVNSGANFGVAEATFDELILSSAIWIDGALLDEPHRVCVNAVLQSFRKGGPRNYGDWHFVFTCGCGYASCANIDEGVGSVHHDETTEWVFRRPQANKFGEDVLGFKQWCETAKWHTYRFNRHQAITELIRFLDESWEAISTSEIYVSDKQTLLNWFGDDPRYFMRWRHNEEWTPTIEPRPL